jgi:hypothetical protein
VDLALAGASEVSTALDVIPTNSVSAVTAAEGHHGCYPRRGPS